MLDSLHCAHCLCLFTAPETMPWGQALEQLRQRGPWQSLGDGETLEDQIHASLSLDQGSSCPVCRADVRLTEEDLGKLSRELLAQW